MKYVRDVWSFLDGKKTFIGGAVIFFAGGAKALGWIDQDIFEIIITVGGAIAVYGLRFALEQLISKRKK